MASHTFLWHDYETFGINPRRDRPAQFAGIRTDAELNEIGEPLMIYCKPANDYLPNPESCLLTGITPQLCLERGVAEHEFAAQIEAVLAEQFETDLRSAAAVRAHRPQRFLVRLADATARLFSPLL